ncbi:hypothetical protein TS65_24985 [Aneurinibacillus migulanus]|uniref:Uncharacterized protein n=1 Tax=Aneurinibacillus migulanus TaxID=47500 RepID=A0A0D1W7K5_ANEMI|nr:hypothetical protein TS65_24985 [Aneurinibacillus migulanus]KIV54475.1 hypothetical protein TS64_15630 [Aneurinibacillus migulanus]KON97946.1 hypothetical protein AF333_23465 [Aneurinibacillus migulanus]
MEGGDSEKEEVGCALRSSRRKANLNIEGKKSKAKPEKINPIYHGVSIMMKGISPHALGNER